MPKCQQCDTKLDSSWHFCPNCGKSDKPGLMNLTDEMLDKVFSQLLSANSDSSETVGESSASKFGTGVRRQVFEVIVRQAIAGAPWRKLCAGPMKVNGITEEDVDREIRRRRKGNQPAGVPTIPPLPASGDVNSSVNLTVNLPLPSELLAGYRLLIRELSQNNELSLEEMRQKLNDISVQLEKLVLQIRQVEQNQQNNN